MKTFDELPMFLTPRELAKLTGEHVNSIRRGITEGRIVADKVNGRWRISREQAFPNTSAASAEARRVEGGSPTMAVRP